jgi:hypothetical protein
MSIAGLKLVNAESNIVTASEKPSVVFRHSAVCVSLTLELYRWKLHGSDDKFVASFSERRR